MPEATLQTTDAQLARALTASHLEERQKTELKELIGEMNEAEKAELMRLIEESNRIQAEIVENALREESDYIRKETEKFDNRQNAENLSELETEMTQTQTPQTVLSTPARTTSPPPPGGGAGKVILVIGILFAIAGGILFALTKLL